MRTSRPLEAKALLPIPFFVKWNPSYIVNGKHTRARKQEVFIQWILLVYPDLRKAKRHDVYGTLG